MSDELRKAAEAATPGPWHVTSKWEFGPRSNEDDQSFGMVIPIGDVFGENRGRDAAYLRMSNPAAILALLDQHEAAIAAERARADALAKDVERLREAFKLADSIACDAMRWGYYASDEAIAVLVNARAIAEKEA